MMSRGAAGEASSYSESYIIKTLKEFSNILSEGNTDSLWIPTHLVHDAESDDMLCWLLLEHILRVRGLYVKVLIQLPSDEHVNEIARKLAGMPHTNVIRDVDSQNVKAIQDYHGIA